MEIEICSVFSCGLLHSHPNCLRLFSSNSEILSDQRKSFAVSYLINSCGLSPEAANVVSKKVTLKSPEKTDLLMTLLRNHGLTDADITKLTVLPKIEFFHSIGMPPHDLALVTSRRPAILRCSLENRIIPFYHYLKNLLQSGEKVITVFKRATKPILKKYDVKESNILSLTVHHTGSLMMRSDELVKIVNRVIELGIDVSKSILSRQSMCSIVQVNLGSQQKICMHLSEKKIMSVMEFCVNEMNCEAKAIAIRPTVLLYSLEKRIMPRCRVVKLLMVKGLMEGPYNLLSLLVMTDKTFSEGFCYEIR
ncbi:Mitochondrial transcription termination factor, mTERF [Handroanthus impetiginosus]|uniref:Mitochondrial transcription termination factor, mTERF n=1 Tax=Handroanthus impetiginosus TaxID=429701 RepID=A0A2G9G355_9LAMI|nr:Mitochondrial transcription termination factor, mTERF [Handroanthus impetiginosus]